jgi:hypothetical protein
MIISKDIPAQTGVNHDIGRITFNLSQKLAYVEIHPDGKPQQVISVDILDLFTKYSITTVQKNVIRAFFKYVVAEAMEISESIITEPIFSES